MTNVINTWVYTYVESVVFICCVKDEIDVPASIFPYGIAT